MFSGPASGLNQITNLNCQHGSESVMLPEDSFDNVWKPVLRSRILTRLFLSGEAGAKARHIVSNDLHQNLSKRGK
jgi:hypothetical protein